MTYEDQATRAPTMPPTPQQLPARAKIKEPHELREERHAARQEQLAAQPQAAPVEKSARHKRIAERMERVRLMKPDAERVRVVPRDDRMRVAIKHPAGVAFRSSGSSEWPMDQFTKRRLREGSVTLEKREQQPADEQQPQAEQRKGRQRSSSQESSS